MKSNPLSNDVVWTASYPTSFEVQIEPGTWGPALSSSSDDYSVGREGLYCPHACGADWHSGPLTVMLYSALKAHSLEYYQSDLDDTPVRCIGSDHEGPVRPLPFYNAPQAISEKIIQWPNPVLYADQVTHLSGLTEAVAAIAGIELPEVSLTTWLPMSPEESQGAEATTLEIDGQPVDFGPDNWVKTDDLPVCDVEKVVVDQLVASNLPALVGTDFPVPDSPGIDFTQYQFETPKYPKGKK